LKVITLAREGLAGVADQTDSEGLRADFHALQGVAHKHLLAYTDAFDCFERAGVVFDEAGSADGAARSTLLAAQLTALDLANIHDALSLVEGAAQLRGARDGELYVEFQLLRAYAAYRGGNLDTARELMPELRRRCAGQHPRLRARVAMFELCFGLETQERRHLELLAAVQAVEPRSARMKLLDPCGYSEASLNLTPKVRQRLQELFELDAPDSSIHECLGRAHMFRLMGEPDCAAAVLRGFLVEPAAKDANNFFFCHWLIQQALRQLGESTDYRSLLKPMSLVISSAEGLLNAWWDGLQVESALEAVRAGDFAEAETVAQQGAPFAALAGQMQPLWLSRIEEVQFYSLEHRPPGSHAEQTAERFESMGDSVMARRIIEEWQPFAPQPQMAGAEPPEAPEAPPRMAAPMPSAPLSPPGAPLKMSEPPSFGVPNERPHGSLSTPEPVSESLPSDSRVEAEIQIGTGGLPDLAREALNSNENAIDILLGRWHELADQLSDRLERDVGSVPATLAFEVAPQAASLPWELAPFIGRCGRYWRKNAHARAPAMPRGSRVDRVLLVRPRQGSGDISLESASGGSLESLYTVRNGAPDFHVLFDPTPEMLIETLQRTRPTIVHINAAMRELQGGIFLDFESTESRADERGARHGALTKYAQSASVASERRELVWSTTRLGRTLQSAPEPLTLVLDIAASSNLTETIRMLLLRNQFANQVFQFAPMCALVGTGLASEYERFELSRAMIDGLLAGGAFGVIRALRDCPTNNVGDLLSALPRLAPALWAHDAHAGVFAS
ncbi:MAG TPA: hypothetical protein VEW08_07835, partial [Steroidobacteraceae bacterium]|nr:hypothetical protein [Steroidobacteraceae bacterium]